MELELNAFSMEEILDKLIEIKELLISSCQGIVISSKSDSLDAFEKVFIVSFQLDKEYIDKLIIEKSKKKDRALELKMELILWYFQGRQNDEYCVEILLNFNTNELCRMNFSKIHIIPMKYIYNGCFSV